MCMEDEKSTKSDKNSMSNYYLTDKILIIQDEEGNGSN